MKYNKIQEKLYDTWIERFTPKPKWFSVGESCRQMAIFLRRKRSKTKKR